MKKIKYLLFALAAMLVSITSCTDEPEMTLLEEIQVSSSYVSLPMDGGSTFITVTAQDSWTAEKVTTDKNKVEWLTLSTTGSAGESQITFTAPATLNGRSAEVLIKSGGQTQRINVIQGLPTISTATAAEVNAGIDGKVYQVSGTVTKIENTVYGNWFLTDKTGTVYIYGTLDKKGDPKNFSSLGIEVGDEVTIQGPKSEYKGSPQMVNVMVININKSLIKVDSTMVNGVKGNTLPFDGGEIATYITNKGQGVTFEIPADAKSWLSLSSMQSSGTNVVMKFKAIENKGAQRSTTLTFKTTDGKKEYSTTATIIQQGAITSSIADFLAAPVSNLPYRLSGTITKIDDAASGKVYIKDYSGKEVSVYKITGYDKNLKVGDVITIIGNRAEYNGKPQVSNSTLEKTYPFVEATIAQVLTKPDDANKYFKVSGTITSIDKGDYGNLYLKDATGEIYVYGVYPLPGATGDARKGLIAKLGIKVGDTLTVIATKGSYKGTNQLTNGFYYSHVSAQ